MSLPPANWYPAPDDPSRERWWNGAEWSETFRPAGQAAPPPVPTYGQPLPYTTGYSHPQYGAAVPTNGLASIAGIALSGVGLARARQAEASGGVAVGKSAATAGLVIGIISLVLNLIWIAWLASNPYLFSF